MTPGAANKSDIRTRQKEREETLVLQNAQDFLQLEERQNQYESERSILRWGGLGGMMDGVVFIFVPVILFGFAPQVPSGSFMTEGGGRVDPTALVMTFPDSRMPIIVGNFLNFLSVVLSLALILALYRALRGTSPAPALWGSALYIIGLGVIFTETVTQVAFDPISSLYHAPGVTPAEQTTLVIMWQAIQSVFFELDAAAILVLSMGLVVLGVAMIGAPRFGKTIGSPIIVLGGVGLLVTSVFGITSFLVAIILVPAFIIVPILLGWKVHGMSRSHSSSVATRGN